MKMKSFAILAVSGLLTAALGYAVPAMADDMNTGGSSMQSNSPSSDSQNQNNTNTGSSGDTSSNSSSDSMNSDTNSDQGNPDTPSGDDDY